jgi:uncharacterized protein
MHANPDIDIVAFYNFERDVRSLAQHCQSGEFRALPALLRPPRCKPVEQDCFGGGGCNCHHWLSALEASGQIAGLEPWFFSRTKSVVKSSKGPKLYLADAGPLCALLNIRSEEALRQTPSAREIWND